MITLSWNCRGLGQPTTVPALCELVRARRPDVIFLFETLSFGVRLESLRVKLNFHSCFSVDCVGRSGGIAVLWNNNISCSVLSYSQNHIDLLINDLLGNWRLTGCYGFPERHRRQASWNLLRHLATVDNLPWLCIGDYNDLLLEDDKKGGVLHPQWLFRGFREAIMDCHLSDVQLSGYKFTWFRGRTVENRIEERLDRAMGNPSWHDRFPQASLLNLIAPVSDHNPILLKTEGYHLQPRRKKFRFENRWFQEKDLKEVISRCWSGFRDLDVVQRLSATAETLETWGNKADSNFRWEKKMLEKKIEKLQAGKLPFDLADYNESKIKLGRLLV